jgi:hypothetical protein
MVYIPESGIVDHSRMPSLLISAEDFAECKKLITSEFARRARIHFLANSSLRGSWERAAA